MKNTEELPDLIPLNKLIDDLEFQFFAAHAMRMEGETRMKERASILVYLKRYRDSLKKEDSHHEGLKK